MAAGITKPIFRGGAPWCCSLSYVEGKGMVFLAESNTLWPASFRYSICRGCNVWYQISYL